MPKIKINFLFCKICERVIYEDVLVCDNCKTDEFILHWGDFFFDEVKIKLEITGEYPSHCDFWLEYKNKRI